MFNIDLTFLWTAINLGILYYFVKRFLFSRLAKNMDERSAAIAAGLSRGEELKAEAEQFKQEREGWQRDTSQRQKSLMDDAKTAANREAERIISEAKDEAARVKDAAQAQIELERETMRKDLTKEAISLALTAATGVIGANMDAGRNRALAEKIISDGKVS